MQQTNFLEEAYLTFALLLALTYFTVQRISMVFLVVENAYLHYEYYTSRQGKRCILLPTIKCRGQWTACTGPYFSLPNPSNHRYTKGEALQASMGNAQNNLAITVRKQEI